MEFGRSEDSRVRALGRADVRTWAVSRIEDRSGNYMAIGYEPDPTNGTAVPDTSTTPATQPPGPPRSCA